MKQVDIKGWERYQITDDGRVWSKKNQMYLSTNRKDGNGYPQVVLYSKGKPKGTPIDIHILVAEAFIPNPQNKPTVNHKNHIRTDNRVENLEWATIQEQCDEVWRNNISKSKIGTKCSEETRKKMSENNGRYWLGKHLLEETRKKLSESKKGKIAKNRRRVDQIDMVTGEVIASFSCIDDAVKLGYTQSSIVLCCQGKRISHKGYIWKYA